MRATTSFAFPGANGMIAVMFRVGHDCATAAVGAAMQSSAKIVTLRARRKISHETFIGRPPISAGSNPKSATQRKLRRKHRLRVRRPQCNSARPVGEGALALASHDCLLPRARQRAWNFALHPVDKPLADLAA